MHRFVIGAKPEQHVDHINGDSLDNRKANLRFCTLSQNQQNQKPRKGCTSRYKGVNFNKCTGVWIARINFPKNERAFLGQFHDEEDAAIAYNVAAQILYGDFAWLNPV